MLLRLPQQSTLTTTAASSTTTTTHEGEYHNDNSRGTSSSTATVVPITRSMFRYVLCAALNSCNLGYDIGVSTVASKLVEEDWNLTETQRELLVASINFWAIFGAFLAQYVSDNYGRRKTFMFAAIGFIVGVVIMALSPTYTILMIGRMFVGLGVGIGLAIDPMYIAEISPARHRGKLVTYSEVAINIGIVLGFSTGFFFSGLSTSFQWRLMFLLGAIFPSIMIFLVITVMPESPRWLVSKDLVNEARIVLKDVYEPGYDIEPIVSDIKESLQRDQEAEKAFGWSIIFHPSPSFQRMLLVGVGMAIAQQAVGIDAIQYYLIDVIEESGLNSDKKESVVLILLGLIKLAFVFVGCNLFDSSGRRPLIFISLLGCAGCLLLISICFFIDSTLSLSVIILSLGCYLAFFSIGMGPGGWLIPSEVFSLSIRGKAMSLATIGNRITATLISSTFLSTANAMGWSSFFFMMSLVCLIVFGFLYTYLPETKGRSLEDMSVYFAEVTGDNTILEVEAKLRQQQDSNASGTGYQVSNPSINEVI